MDTELKDAAGNTLAVGDTVAYAGVSRWACPVSLGTVLSMGTASVAIKSRDSGVKVLRPATSVAKVAPQ